MHQRARPAQHPAQLGGEQPAQRRGARHVESGGAQSRARHGAPSVSRANSSSSRGRRRRASCTATPGPHQQRDHLRRVARRDDHRGLVGVVRGTRRSRPRAASQRQVDVRGGDRRARSRRRRAAPRSSPAATSEPGLQHGDVRAGRLDLGEQVRGDDDRGPARVQLGDDPPDVAGAGRVQAVGRLVEHDQPARQQQRRGEAEPLLHARASSRGNRRSAASASPTRSSAASTAAGIARVASSGSVAATRRRFSRPDRNGWNPGPSTSAPTCGSARRRAVGHRSPEQLGRARGGAGEAEQHPDQRGLARAVRAEHAEHGAGRDVEVDAVHGDGRPEDLAQPDGPGRDGRRTGVRRRRSRRHRWRRVTGPGPR